MLLSFIAVIAGLALLVWSADKFVEGAAATARYFGMSPLLIGMVIIGFGTSAPEIVVSALASLQGNPGIALGNAYGSNITNIALILGLTALLSPIAVHSQVVRKEMPVLLLVSILAIGQLYDGLLSRNDAWTLLAVFALLLGWSIWQSRKKPDDVLNDETTQALEEHAMSLRAAAFWVVLGLLLLIISSRLLVWGAVSIAQAFGVSDLIIGLTVVAIGTSLPELASSLVAVRKNEHDLALGNIIGSNLFNTLIVVGIAGAIHPLAIEPELLYRDMLTMGALTLFLLLACISFGGVARIGRIKGAILLTSYIAYTAYLINSAFLAG